MRMGRGVAIASKGMKNMMWGVLLAFQFLTRIPIPLSCPWNDRTLSWALRSFPLVGLSIGSFVVVTYLLAEQLFPTWFCALTFLSIWVALTGGLHLDGWADLADALGSNAPLAKKWEIMKDPHIGSFGMMALLFLLLWKLSLIYLILESNKFDPWLFLFIPAMARWGGSLLLGILPAAKKQGLAWEWKKSVSMNGIAIALVPVFLVGIYHTAPLSYMLGLFLAQLLFVGLYSIWIWIKFKGMNGDIIGATIEGGELWLLLVIYIWSVMV